MSLLTYTVNMFLAASQIKAWSAGTIITAHRVDTVVCTFMITFFTLMFHEELTITSSSSIIVVTKIYFTVVLCVNMIMLFIAIFSIWHCSDAHAHSRSPMMTETNKIIYFWALSFYSGFLYCLFISLANNFLLASFLRQMKETKSISFMWFYILYNID